MSAFSYAVADENNIENKEDDDDDDNDDEDDELCIKWTPSKLLHLCWKEIFSCFTLFVYFWLKMVPTFIKSAVCLRWCLYSSCYETYIT